LDNKAFELIIICFSLLFSKHSTYFLFNIYLYVCFLFCVLFLPPLYSCLFYICVHFYRTLPPGVNPIAVNKYHITSHITMKDIYVVINIRCNAPHFKHTGLQLQPRGVLRRTRQHESHRTVQPTRHVSVSHTESETNHSKDAYESEFSVHLKRKQRQ